MYENATFGEIERHCLLAMTQSPEVEVHKAAFNYAVHEVRPFCRSTPLLHPSTLVHFRAKFAPRI